MQQIEIMAERRYPIGIQTFLEMIWEGYVYYDKGYVIPYDTDSRKTVKVDATFNPKSRTIA